jgi:hypothetical protein
MGSCYSKSIDKNDIVLFKTVDVDYRIPYCMNPQRFYWQMSEINIVFWIKLSALSSPNLRRSVYNNMNYIVSHGKLSPIELKTIRNYISKSINVIMQDPHGDDFGVIYDWSVLGKHVGYIQFYDARVNQLRGITFEEMQAKCWSRIQI